MKNRNLKIRTSLFVCCLIVQLAAHAQKKLTVIADKPVTPVAPTMWGIFFEDINFGADGGLYAELVKNRSYEFLNPMMGWKELKQNGKGRTLIINRGNEKPENPRFARITVDSAQYGLSNEGFRGMGIQKGKQYNFSILAKKGSGNVNMKIELVNASGKKIGAASLSNFSGEWTKQTASFTTSDTASKGRLNVLFEGNGSVDVDMISLFPQETWKNRPNGLRADLVQMLADLKPGFIRFPGGCIVEGRELQNRYRWKTTVGPVEDRMSIMNRWNVEFKAPRNAPDYFQSFGIGFYEYFQLAEDIGATPLPILNCGMACQYNTAEVAPLDQLDPYVQDALDLIEERNADVVKMASYAPLFAHVEAWQWRPDLIWFDNLRTVGTPNYYVQKLFANNKGTHVIQALQDSSVLAGKDSIYASAVLDKTSKQVIIKLVNAATASVSYELNLAGIKPNQKEATVEVLTSPEAYAYNTFDQQKNIYPQQKTIGLKGNKLDISLAPLSLNVIKVSVR